MKNDPTVLVPLAEGFEEIEAVAIIDVLRRAGVHVTVAGLRPGPVLGAHGITVATDAALDEVDPARVRALVLPGGQPGTDTLAADPRVLALVRSVHGAGKLTAALCAAPLVLAAAGVLEGVQVTSHPSVRQRLGAARVVAAARVVCSGTIVTSQGPGTALEFALALVERLAGPEKARDLALAMLVGPPDGAPR